MIGVIIFHQKDMHLNESTVWDIAWMSDQSAIVHCYLALRMMLVGLMGFVMPCDL